MIELRDDLHLALKSGDVFRVSGSIGREHLDRDRSLQSTMDGLEDGSHPATSKDAQHLILAASERCNELLIGE
jgi:hypothetical protein